MEKLNINSIKSFLPIFIALLLSLFLLSFFVSKLSSGEDGLNNFEDFALGTDTVALLGEHDGKKVHCHNLSDANDCLQPYLDSDFKKDAYLWLGNSQIHSINQLKNTDKLATSILHSHFAEMDKYFISFSQANANLQEHYLLFRYLLQKIDVDTLVLPIIFDDLRETGIRSTVISALQDNEFKKTLSQENYGRQIIKSYSNQNFSMEEFTDDGGTQRKENDTAGLDGSLQKKAELFLNNELSKHSDIWDQRPLLRGNFFIYLYRTRNWVFNINPSSKRNLIPGRYALNIKALENTLIEANKRSIRVITYIPPLRDDAEIPYDLDEYNDFINTVKNIAQKNNAQYANFEKIIPNALWGLKDTTTLNGGSEIDFMHFQGDGHKILAAEIIKEIDK